MTDQPANSPADKPATPTARIKNYLSRAEECRRLAQTATVPEFKADYARLAQLYEDLAKRERELMGRGG